MHQVVVGHDFKNWRPAARSLLKLHVPPEEVLWTDEGGVLFGNEVPQALSRPCRRGDTCVAHARQEVLVSRENPGRLKSRPHRARGTIARVETERDPHRLAAPLAGRVAEGAPQAGPLNDEKNRDTDSAHDARLNVPARFIAIAQHVAAHRDPQRWSLLYRVLWRLTQGREPHLLEVAVDDDVRALSTMDREVRHDVHRMHAFVRFRSVKRADALPASQDGAAASIEGSSPADDRDASVASANAVKDDDADADRPPCEHYIAWHRPDHRVLRLAIPFFRERFGSLRWTIFTPDESATWDGHQLVYGPGVPQRDVPGDDELEQFWRTYYASTFNPARMSEKTMLQHLPRRYWASLPEATIIADLLRDAPRRMEEMVAKASKTEAFPTAAAFMPPKLTLPQLRSAAAVCKGCDLYKCGTQTVFGKGPSDADVIFVGEQPGDMEDRAGEPFVGPAGQVLDEALEQVGIDRSTVYVTNAVKHFKWEPRGKRRIHSTPNVREQAACRPWLQAEIAAVAPKLIVCLGATASQALLGKTFRVTQHRGEILKDTGWAPAVIATVHPSSILRTPDPEMRDNARKAFIEDMKIIKREIARVTTEQAKSNAHEKARQVQHDRAIHQPPSENAGEVLWT